MKNIMHIVLSVMLISIASFAQSNGLLMTSKNYVFADSLYYGAPGDSVWTIDAKFATGFKGILKGNSNSSVDSLKLELGIIRYNTANFPVDTIWTPASGFKIVAGTVATTLINTSTGLEFSVEKAPAFNLLRFSILNYRLALATRKLQMAIITQKD